MSQQNTQKANEIVPKTPQANDQSASILQNLLSVPVDATQLYFERQSAGAGTCGVHALNNFFGNQICKPSDLIRSGIKLEKTNIILPAYDRICEFLQMLSEDKIGAVWAELSAKVAPKIPGEETAAKAFLKDVCELKGQLGKAIASGADNIYQVVDLANKLCRKLTSNGTSVKTPNFDLLGLQAPFLALSGTIDINRHGTDPGVVAEFLKSKGLGVEQGKPEDFSPNGRILNIPYLCQQLESRQVSRAIIAGSGHFLAVRKTEQEKWCVLDSLSSGATRVYDIGPGDRRHRQGCNFYGVIYVRPSNR